MIVYRARFGDVAAFEAEEKGARVCIGGHWRLRKSSWEPVFNTAKEAWDWVVLQAEAEHVDAVTKAEFYEGQLKEARAKRAAYFAESNSQKCSPE